VDKAHARNANRGPERSSSGRDHGEGGPKSPAASLREAVRQADPESTVPDERCFGTMKRLFGPHRARCFGVAKIHARPTMAAIGQTLLEAANRIPLDSRTPTMA